MEIYGMVVVGGEEFQDNDIAQLVGKDVTGWEYFEMDFEGEFAGNICVIAGDQQKSFYGRNGLPEALEFIQQNQK